MNIPMMVAATNSARRSGRGGGGDPGGDEPVLFVEILLLSLLFVMACLLVGVVGVCSYQIWKIHADRRAAVEKLRDYAAKNDGLVEIVRCLGETDVYKYGKHKRREATSYDVVVEIRGLKDGRCMILREHRDRVVFDHLPQAGEVFRFIPNDDLSINLTRARE